MKTENLKTTGVINEELTNIQIARSTTTPQSSLYNGRDVTKMNDPETPWALYLMSGFGCALGSIGAGFVAVAEFSGVISATYPCVVPATLCCTQTAAGIALGILCEGSAEDNEKKST